VAGRYKYIAHRAFISLTVPLLSFCATLIVLTIVTPQFRAPSAGATIEVPKEAIAPAAEPVALVVPIASPVQLKIAKINVDTTMAAVGINAKGDMDIDEDPNKAAWYKLGAKPGEVGNAVIAGHYGWKNRSPSVFNDLHTLVKGDTISTVAEDGKVMTFVVSRLATYAPEQDATDVFISNDGKAHLNLVTCQGSWNNSIQTYSERLVVFSDLVVQ